MSIEEPLRDPDIPDGETTSYVGAINGRDAGRGTLTVHHDAGRYRQRIEATLEGGVAYELEMEFARVSGFLVAEHYRLAGHSRDQRVSVEEGWFRGVRALHFGGAVQPYPRSITPLLGCAVALRGLDFERGAKRSVSVWLANTVHWEIGTRVERAERVAVHAGSFDAWRVRVRPSFEAVAKQLDRFIGLFLPPFILHFERAAPHRVLRFEFPTGPFPWNPRAVIQAAALE